jgi:hypothetical protein
MDQDDFTDTVGSDDQLHRRSFGGLGRGPAALLLAAGLLIGGGVGGFIHANASSPISTYASSTPATSHTCPTTGGTTAN